MKKPFIPYFEKFNNIADILTPSKFYKKNGVEYSDLACSFDIETSSFYYSKQLNMYTKSKPQNSDEKYFCKCATMYMWGLGINGKVVIKRTWGEFIETLDNISKYYQLNYNERHLVIYVHNLGYEFQFMRKYLKIKKMFAIKEREPIYFACENGIEFRCSYLLSGYKLENVANNFTYYTNVKKLVETLDYDLIRHSKTKISDIEYSYLVNDNLCVMCYIEEYKMKYKNNITRLPYTKTGVVRKLCRDNCFYINGSHKLKSTNKYQNYVKYIHNMNIKSVAEYKQLKRAFCGGFTHANAYHVGHIYNNVASFDFTSSYPYCLCAYRYPVGTGEIVNIKSHDEMEKYLKNYCCIFDIEFIKIESSISFEHFLSSSKCETTGELIEDNGRVVYADNLKTTLTNIDFEIVKKVYSWEKIRVSNFRIYHKNYLPKDLILTCLKLYHDKTTLKGVDNKLIEYMSAKENVNSIY